MNDSLDSHANGASKKNSGLNKNQSTVEISEQAVDKNLVLAEATLAASEALGLSKSSLSRVIGKDRSRLKQGIRIDSKPGELAMLLIRCYRGLYALVDGDESVMRHWMSTYNHGTVGIPCEQIETVQGLSQVLAYLDAIRGKL
ncbi:MAG: antitoxin Xre/MbcA/ParS toxin-binding domain-containing protein [Granulosicoccus sp.]